jgi:hypothetical protein
MANSIIYSKGFRNNIIGDVDQYIENIIVSALPADSVFINTTWLEVTDELISTFNKNKVAICYSGPDWENTNCIDIRKNAHALIANNFKDVKHIGNTRGKFYFNFWLEFIRQHSKTFFDDSYITTPKFEKLYMCLNRKPHAHRLFLVDLLEKNNLLSEGYVSVCSEKKTIFLNENISDSIRYANESVVDDLPIVNDIISLGDPHYWNSHFINVVTETTIHTDLFISEKTWKPIIGLRPFLILGDYNIYNQLKTYGFDTFDDLFGAWYTDKNWENRAKSIITILKYYKNEDINKIYKDILKRLIKNRDIFLKITQENLEFLKNGKFLTDI